MLAPTPETQKTMCIQNAIQSKIAELTDNGETIATFLAETLQGQSDHAIQIHHRLDAARMLTKYGISQPTEDPANSIPSPIKGDGQDGGDENHPSLSAPSPTLRDIVAYPVARYIRNRTDNGETLVHTLRNIMDGGDYDRDPFTDELRVVIKPHHRLAAAKELLRRAFGEYRPPRSNSVRHEQTLSPLMGEGWDGGENPSIDVRGSDPLNADLAKLVRERTTNGIDAAELLVRVVENEDEDWQPAHRLSAAKELLHRAYDLNYKAVSWEHLDAYNRATETHDEVADLEQARIEAGGAKIIREFDEAYAAGDKEAMRVAEEKYEAYHHRIRNGEDPDEAAKYAEHGPDDPDPDVDYYHQPLSEEAQAKFYREVVQGSAALSIPTPKLTIPVNNRSP